MSSLESYKVLTSRETMKKKNILFIDFLTF